MFSVSQNPYILEFDEPVGIAHDVQTVVVDWPSGTSGSLIALRDEIGGAHYPLQRSRVNNTQGFLQISIAAGQSIRLVASSEQAEVIGWADAKPNGDSIILSNERFAIALKLGENKQPDFADHASGPVEQWRHADGPWRGYTYFDTNQPLSRWTGRLVERGPLRFVYEYSAQFAGGGAYEFVASLDAGAAYAQVSESFDCDPGDQLVWQFEDADLPSAAFLLNSDAGYTRRELPGHIDQRVTRLAAWTQYQQLIDLSDGFALEFGDADDIVGLVTLTGGRWRGANLNHIELWQRRIAGNNHLTRRRVPSDAKADSNPAPYGIPARGGESAKRNLTLECWIGSGRRDWAFVIARKADLLPAPDPNVKPAALGHFDEVPHRETYRQSQGLLRRVHARSMFSLQDQMALSFKPDLGDIDDHPSPIPFELMSHHLSVDGMDELSQSTRDYLDARVYGFWEGSGAAYTNCVAGRRIAPEMLRYEYLVRTRRISDADRMQIGSKLLFLAHLFESDNYYPGWTTMEPVGSPETTEPSLTGMANQNFYTDVINVFAMAAEVFQANPSTAAWREKFAKMWQRQLEYHVYPSSGLWEESHTYFQHVLLTVAPTMLKRLHNGTADDFANPLLQRLVGGALKQLTPRDDAFGGRRHLVAFGDHAVDIDGARDVYRAFSQAFASHAPELAAQLAWAYQQMEGTLPLSVTPTAPEWKSEHVEGLGYMLRGVDNNGIESLLALRCGCAWGHHHADDGSIQLFARGRALIVDAAYGNVQDDSSRKFQAVGHSRWSLRDQHPVNHLFRFNRGWITDSAEGPLPFAVAFTPVYMAGHAPNHYYELPKSINHYRVVFALNATSFLVLDTGDSTEPQVVRFHIAGRNVEAEGDGYCARHHGGDFAAPRLTIAPIICGQNLGAVRTDSPSHGSQYDTTEVAWTPNQAGVSLCLIAADEPRSAAAKINVDGDRVTLAGDDYKVEFEMRAVYGKRPETATTGDGIELWLDGGAVASGIDRGSWLVSARRMK